MRHLLKRLRGALGIGLTWGVVWAGLGAALGIVIGIRNPRYWQLGNPITDTAFGFAVAGVIAGAGFSFVLGWLERGRSLEKLARIRVALWGAAGHAL